MLLMSGVTLLMLFFLPKIKDTLIDPETQQELLLKQQSDAVKRKEEMPQVQMPDVAANLADWFAPKSSPKSSPKTKKKAK
jgi:hypothetical protein